MSEKNKPKKEEQQPPAKQQQNPILTLFTMINNISTKVSEQGVDIKATAANMDLFDKRANFLAERIDDLLEKIKRLEN